MPIGFLIIGIGAGLASALLFYSAARGSPLLSTMLLLLTPLPTLLAGLGWGWVPAAVGAARRRGGDGLAVSSPSSRPAISWRSGMPAALAAYLAYLSRPDPTTRASASGIRPAACWPPCRSTAARCRCWCCR